MVVIMEEQVLEIIQKIFRNVFSEDNPYSLEEILEKIAFDVKLPKKVFDSTTNEITWADSIHFSSFITQSNMEKRDLNMGWMLPKVKVDSLEQLISIWQSINFTTTERVSDSSNVSLSDTIYGCENVYHCTNCSGSKNIVYCDSCSEVEFLLASQRSTLSSFCIRVDDSINCSNCYNVIWSNKVSNSFFIQDCFDLYECIFCSHIANKKYCIANMQFDADEYFQIKKEIISWILSS